MKCLLAAAMSAGAAAVTIRGGAQSFALHESMEPKDLEESLLNLLGSSSKNTPALLKFVDQIEVMIENNMKPPVLQHNREEQRRLDALPGSFRNCSAGLAKDLGKVKALQDAATAAKRDLDAASATLFKAQQAEKDCLAQLKVFSDLQSSTCSLLNEGKFDLPAQHRVPSLCTGESNPCGCSLNAASYGADAANRAQCFTKQLGKFQAADTACSCARKKAAEQKKICDGLTAKVRVQQGAIPPLTSKADNAACVAATRNKAACSSNDACHADALKKFQSTVAAVRIQEIGMKGEWESIQRLQCLAGSIKRTDEARPAAIKACKDQDVDTSRLNLVYPRAPPTKETCSVAAGFKCKAR